MSTGTSDHRAPLQPRVLQPHPGNSFKLEFTTHLPPTTCHCYKHCEVKTHLEGQNETGEKQQTVYFLVAAKFVMVFE